MKIWIQQLGGAEPLNVDSQATLSDLETLIRDAKGIDDKVEVELVFNETLLEANMSAICRGGMECCKRKLPTTLEEYGIAEGVRLTMIKCCTPLVLTSSADGTAKTWNS